MKRYLPAKTKSSFLAEAGLYIAITIILSRFFSITFWNQRIGFAFIPILVSAIRLGPFGSFSVALLADLIGASLFPLGPINLGITFDTSLVGFLYGIFFFHGINQKKLFFFLLISQVGVYFFLQTLWLSQIFGQPYLVTLGSRIPNTILQVVVKWLVITGLEKSPYYKQIKVPSLA